MAVNSNQEHSLSPLYDADVIGTGNTFLRMKTLPHKSRFNIILESSSSSSSDVDQPGSSNRMTAKRKYDDKSDAFSSDAENYYTRTSTKKRKYSVRESASKCGKRFKPVQSMQRTTERRPSEPWKCSPTQLPSVESDNYEGSECSSYTKRSSSYNFPSPQNILCSNRYSTRNSSGYNIGKSLGSGECQESSDEDDFSLPFYAKQRSMSQNSMQPCRLTYTDETSSETNSSSENEASNVKFQPNKLDVVAIDCEMVSCSPNAKWLMKSVRKIGKRKKNPSEVSVAAQCAIVDYDYKTIYNSYIRSDLHITNRRGMSSSDLEDAVPFEQARKQILHLLKNKLVVANDIRHDLASLQIHLERDIANKNIRDTSTCSILCSRAKVPTTHPNASLQDLAKGVLGRKVQKKKPHNPVEDARVAMELYREVEDEWERQIQQTMFPPTLH